jgi:hypothetical protein
VTGEASPYYLFHPHAPARAGEVLGDARIIVILRDPVERAHSHHAERRANGVEPLTFEEALAAEADRLAGEQERLEEDPSYRSFAHEHQSYVAQGRYADSVARWRKHFPPEQLLILCSEELFADPEGQLRRVHAFLGLPHRRPPDLSARNPVQRELMPAALRHELEACFASDFRRLERLVDRTFPWSSSGGPATDPEDLGGLQPTTDEGRLL